MDGVEIFRIETITPLAGEDIVFATARGYGEFKGGWEFPGGKIEEGETELQAAVRELWEETGLNLTEIKDVWPISYSAVGIMNERSIVVIGTAEGEFAPSTSDEEEIEAIWFTKEQMKELLKTNVHFAARTQAYCWCWANM